MHNLGGSVQVQAAGSWALAAMAGKNEDLREQALADGAAGTWGVVGGIPNCFRAGNTDDNT